MASEQPTGLENQTLSEPHRLTHLSPSFDSNEAALACRKNLWHKFIIFNGALHLQTDILRALITACELDVLIPVMYTVEDNNSTFLAKCSGSTIENIVKRGLRITLSNGPELLIDIVLGFIDAQHLSLNTNKVVAQVLHSRYEPMKKIFNLDDFENDKALGPIFCPISVPNVLRFVLRCSKVGIMPNNPESRLPVRELSLKYNKIVAIILFDKLFSYHLTKLDIRYNQILDIEYLRYFSEFKISELWLDGNPLCTKYTNSHDYIQAVTTVFPHLQKLDGIVIGTEQKFVPIIQINYLGDGTRIPLIKQFVKHFFTLYDQEDKTIMNGLYDKNAFYSMTIGTVINHTNKQITKSFSTNRNLLKFVDYAKCHEFLLCGPNKIITAFQQQPITVHYFKTFHIDLLHEGDNYIAISVQGLFSYRTVPPFPPMLFNRTFIIIKKEDNEYCIINDQHYIDNSSVNAAWLSKAKLEQKSVPKFTPTVLSLSEKQQLLKFLHELTTMNLRFCHKYLQQTEWDIRTAISTFMKNYAVNDVPPEAFK